MKGSIRMIGSESKRISRRMRRAQRSSRPLRAACRSAVEQLESRLLFTTVVVNTTVDDSSVGTLRAAIEAVNQSTDQQNTIQFDIASDGAVKTIALVTPLPALQDVMGVAGKTVVIDGTTEFGYAGSPLVQLFGVSSGIVGLEVDMNATIKGLAISHFAGPGGVGIHFGAGSDGSTLMDSYIGTDATGTIAEGNSTGVVVDSANVQLLDNLISGNSNVTDIGVGVLVHGNKVQIQGNFIGTDFSGSNALGNSGEGIWVVGASGALIGGASAGDGNVIAANQKSGILLVDSTNSFIEGNIVGLDQSGSIALGNLGAGIEADGGSGIQIGGDQPGMGNLVAASQGSGIWIFQDNAGNGSTGDTIAGNILGTDASVALADPGFGNGGDGINVGTTASNITVTANVAGNNHGSGLHIQGSSGEIVQGNFLGTDVSGTRFMPNAGDGATLDGSGITFTGNVASGNTGNGITISGSLNYVANNRIGTAANGQTPLGNLGDGILIFGNENTITANIIAYNGTPDVNQAFNSGSGVGVRLGKMNAIERNSIFSNTTLGIDLNDNNLITPTEDLGGDTDLQSNDDQMFPVITSVTNIQGHVTINGTLNSPATPNTTFVIDFYSTDPTLVNVSGHLEGQTWLDSVTVQTDSTGHAFFSDTIVLPSDQVVLMATATSSDPNFPGAMVGDTSEFSSAAAVPPPSGPVINPTQTNLNSSDNTSQFGQNVTLTAAVMSDGAPIAVSNEIVIFKDGSVQIGSSMTINGVASLTLTGLSVGPHDFTAFYSGDASFADSVSNDVAQLVNPADSLVTLNSSVNPSVFGQTVQFTSTLTSNGGTPTGSASLFEDSALISSMTLDASGQAAWSFSDLPVGQHTLYVSYGGDGNFAASQSANFLQTVQQAGTRTTITSLLAPVIVGQDVTFRAQVAVVGQGSGTPGGTVAFYDGLTLIGTGVLDTNGLATMATSTLGAGDHVVTAQYLGNVSFLPSVSPEVHEIVGLDQSQTVLSSSSNPSTFGKSVTFTATVLNISPVAGMPSGSVTFYDGGVIIAASVPLDGNDMASVSVSDLSVATHQIMAVYSGDSSFASSTDTLGQLVVRAASSATLASSIDPSVYGQPVTLTAAVSGAGAMPTGSVIFYDGTTQLGVATLDATGQASLTFSGFATGHHSLSVSYAGDGNFTGATSGTLDQLVNPAAATTSLSSSANPSNVGQVVTFTASVAVLAPGAANPTGTITFLDNGVAMVTAVITNGISSWTTSSLTAGSHTITAVYSGDGNVTGSTAMLAQNVSATATVGGHVYRDLTGNGMSADDTAMSGVVVQLFRDANHNGTLDSGDGAAIASFITKANGAYTFSNLASGTYFVQEVTPSGFVRTLPTVSGFYSFDATPGAVTSTDDFDNFKICPCANDLSSYYFADGGHRFSNMSGNVHAGDTISVTFTVKPGETDEFHLVSYTAPDATFVAADACEQQVYQVAGGTYSAGTYTISVKVPKGHFQVDFICGDVIYNFGPAGSNIFYTPQGRLINAVNG